MLLRKSKGVVWFSFQVFALHQQVMFGSVSCGAIVCYILGGLNRAGTKDSQNSAPNFGTPPRLSLSAS